MAQADSLHISFAKETTYKTVPTGSYKVLRATGESMTQVQPTTQSNELIANRNVRQFVRTDLRAAGAVNGEFSFGTYSDWLAWAYCDSETWDAAVPLVDANDNVAIVFTPLTGNIQCVGKFASAVEGRWIILSGLTSTLAAMNGKLYKIMDKVDDDNIIVVGSAPLVSGTQAASGTVNGVITMPEQITNGSTLTSFTLEYHQTDLTSKYRQFPGAQIDQMSLEVSAQGFATVAFNLLASRELLNSAAAGSGYTAAPTTSVMNGFDHVLGVSAGLWLPNVSRSIQATSWSMQLQNNLRARNLLGVLGASSIALGKAAFTGTTRMYFSDATVRADFLAFAYTSQAIEFSDAAGNRYLFEFPRVQYLTDPASATGPNTDIIEEIGWAASEDPLDGVAGRIVRIAA
jgi:hypothetical protein